MEILKRDLLNYRYSKNFVAIKKSWHLMSSVEFAWSRLYWYIVYICNIDHDKYCKTTKKGNHIHNSCQTVNKKKQLQPVIFFKHSMHKIVFGQSSSNYNLIPLNSQLFRHALLENPSFRIVSLRCSMEASRIDAKMTMAALSGKGEHQCRKHIRTQNATV